MVSPGKCTAPIPRSSLPGGRIACSAGLASLASLALLAAPACVREPLPRSCPELTAGDLVVTELRASQSGSSYRPWIELYNASADTVAIAGLSVAFIGQDGAENLGFLVREPLEIEPGGYLVLGGGDPSEFEYIDYDYTPVFHHDRDSDAPPGTPLRPRSPYGAGILELRSCRTLIDRVHYVLPDEGTLALDGASPPDAAGNDDSDESWCVDDRPSMGPITETGIRGTPGEANPPCP